MKTRNLLLICGAVSSALYVAIDLLAAIFHPEYHSFTSQTISELMAHGAPTERLVDPLFLLYDALLIAFGVGLWMSAGQRRPGQITAGALAAIGAIGLLGPTLFEMDVRGAGDGRRDLLHIALTAVMVIVIVVAIGAGAFLHGRRFRLYSFATLLALLVSGALTGAAANDLAAGKPTPWLGVVERLNIGAYLLWVAVLATSLLPRQRSTEPPSARLPGSTDSRASPLSNPAKAVLE
jgi:hypothetical protein